MTAMEYAFLFRAVPDFGQIDATQTYVANVWSPLVSATMAQVGSVGDDVLYVATGRIGDARSNGRDLAFGMRVRSGGWALGLGASEWYSNLADFARPGPPWDNACQTFGLVWREQLGPILPNGSVVQVEAKVGAVSDPGQAASVKVSDVSVLAINLTRMFSRGIGHAYVQDFNENYLFSRLNEVPVGPQLTLPSPATSRTYLVLACGRIRPGTKGSATSVRLRHARAGVEQMRTDPAIVWGASVDVQNSGAPFRHRQNLLFCTVVETDPAAVDTVDLLGIDGYQYVAGQSAASLASGALCAVDISELRPLWQVRDRIGGLYGAAPSIGPAPNKPNHGEYEPLRINGDSGVPTRKIVLATQVPHNQHAPGIVNSFAGQTFLQRDQRVPPFDRPPAQSLYVQAHPPPPFLQVPTGGQPEYTVAEFRTGRGDWTLDFVGWFSPLHDVVNGAGAPTRVFNPRRFLNAGALAFVTFDAVIGAQRDVEPPPPVGAAVYIEPGREGPAVASLPEPPWPPDIQLRGDQQVMHGRLQTFDGRLVTWGRLLRGRRTYSVAWTCADGSVADGTTGTWVDFERWLHALQEPMIRWRPLEDDVDGAWLLVGPARFSDLGGENRRVEMQLVELVWLET